MWVNDFKTLYITKISNIIGNLDNILSNGCVGNDSFT